MTYFIISSFNNGGNKMVNELSNMDDVSDVYRSVLNEVGKVVIGYLLAVMFSVINEKGFFVRFFIVSSDVVLFHHESFSTVRFQMD